MCKFTFIVVLFAITLNACYSSDDIKRVNVDVYYESLCPDSKKFINEILYPALQTNLSDYVNLKLYPYGKSTYIRDQNRYIFACHHGPNECIGNKVHACAINNVEDGRNTPGFGYNKVLLHFINCLMEKADRSKEKIDIFPIKPCAEEGQVTRMTDISNCANHVNGSNYLVQIASKTEKLDPKLTSVPHIVFNDKYTEEDNRMAFTDFAQVLCKYIDTKDKPAECNGTTNIITNLTLIAACIYISFMSFVM